MSPDPRIEFAEKLFAAWSSGDMDAPESMFHPDGTLYDVVGGEYVGWPAIRAFFARGLKYWPDLVLKPVEFWTNDRGLALTWVMTATITDPAMHGPEFVGRVWRVEGMSELHIEDGRIRREVDYHDGGAKNRSLGL